MGFFQTLVYGPIRGEALHDEENVGCFITERILMLGSVCVCIISTVFLIVTVFEPPLYDVSYESVSGHTVNVTFAMWDFYQTAASFSITMIVMIIALIAAGFAFFHHRYAYKRLAVGIFIIEALCALMTVEAVRSTLQWWIMNGNQKRDDLEKPREGLRWNQYTVGNTQRMLISQLYLHMVVCLVTGLIFLVAARKHKGERATNDQLEIDDFNVNLGR